MGDEQSPLQVAFEDDRWVVMDADGRRIADVYGDEDDQEVERRAHQFAAAPDLFAELDRLGKQGFEDTPWFRCPSCDGIVRSMWGEDSAVKGHEPDCRLAAALLKASSPARATEAPDS